MDYRLLLLLSVFGFCTASNYDFRRFHYIDLKMNWTQAQRYCREKYTDLATIESEEDMSKLNRPGISNAWIGLNDDPPSLKTMNNATNSWRWSSTSEPSQTGYVNWRSDSPDNDYAQEACVMSRGDGTWGDETCDSRYHVLCYTVNPPGQKTYVLINEFMNWTDAQAFCRKHHTDLAMIENAQENTEMTNTKSGYYSWIGLYREVWRWSDNRNSSFRNWKEGEPNNAGYSQHCVLINVNHQWEDWSCADKLPFWCQEVPKGKTVMLKMKFQTKADLMDPAINDQLLQQFGAALSEKMGQTNFKLSWKIQPKKIEEEKDQAEIQN